MLVYLADPYYRLSCPYSVLAYARHVLAYLSCPYYSLVYALLILYILRARKIQVGPGLARGLRVGVRVRVSSRGLGGDESPPHWDILERESPTG
jgi:hypothetical protein